MATEQRELVVSQDLINALRLNPAIPIDPNSLVSLATGDTKAYSGCITRLFYRKSGDDLYYIELDNSTIVSTSTAGNLNDFRDRLQEAANFGHGVVFCVRDGEMFMLHIIPCQCKCERRD